MRNLVSEQRFGPGRHTVAWDGYDDGRVDWESGYELRRRADPGEYRVRGLTHDGIRMVYEFAIQSPGSPPWHTADGSGAWLADHSPASAMLYLPPDAGSPHGEGKEQMLVASNGLGPGFIVCSIANGEFEHRGCELGLSKK